MSLMYQYQFVKRNKKWLNNEKREWTMNNYIDENTPFGIQNQHNYSTIIPTGECITYLVQYCADEYQKFTALTEEVEKNKEQHGEYNYSFKKGASLFEIAIRGKQYSNIVCENFQEFEAAIQEKGLKDISSLEIKMHLNFKRDREEVGTEHQNEFVIIFRPYEISFSRKSNYNETMMNQIETNIDDVLRRFPSINSIFSAK